MFDLKALKYFVAVYEEGSVSGAARRCHIAQPSISAALRNLEDGLGARLFERGRAGLTPTPEGERLYPQARNLLGEASAILEGFRAAPPRSLRLHVQDDMPVQRAAPLLRVLGEHLPGVQLRLVPAGEPADLRLISEHDRREEEWLQQLWEEDYVLVLPGSHPLRLKTELAPADLHGCAYVERPYCALNRMFADFLAAQGVQPDLRASAVREEAVLGMVALGLGVTIAPETHCAGLAGVVVRRLPHRGELRRRVGLGCMRQDHETVKLIRELTPALLLAYDQTPPHRS